MPVIPHSPLGTYFFLLRSKNIKRTAIYKISIRCHEKYDVQKIKTYWRWQPPLARASVTKGDSVGIHAWVDWERPLVLCRNWRWCCGRLTCPSAATQLNLSLPRHTEMRQHGMIRRSDPAAAGLAGRGGPGSTSSRDPSLETSGPRLPFPQDPPLRPCRPTNQGSCPPPPLWPRINEQKKSNI